MIEFKGKLVMPGGNMSQQYFCGAWLKSQQVHRLS